MTTESRGDTDFGTADLLPDRERAAMTDTKTDTERPDIEVDRGGIDLTTRELDRDDDLGPVRDVTPTPTPDRAWTDREEDTELLFGPRDSEDFERRWTDVQTRFVDDPREAVESADRLVAEVMQTLARRFAEHKAQLEDQWSGGGDPETEDLRQALRRYRAFFHRLLAA